MLELTGKYTKAFIYADTIEDECISQVYELINHPAFKDSNVRIMPDTHTGANICIGFTAPLRDYVDPNHIGVDIGCSMTSLELSKCLSPDDYANFEHKVRNAVPTGYDIHTKVQFNEKELYKFLTNKYNRAYSIWPEAINPVERIDEKFITKLCSRIGMDLGKFYKSLGTLGSGNHFEEYGETEDGRAFFTIHCGSRNFGLKVAKYWSSRSKESALSKSQIKEYTEEFKKSYRNTHNDMKNFKNDLNIYLESKKSGYLTGYLNGDLLKGYLSDMVIAQAYAEFNHKVICDLVKDILLKFKIKVVDKIYTTHNYISFEDKIMRKGAIASYEGEKMIMPFNMRDGLAICVGKSNEDWNCSAPHGAGRIMSRAKAKANVDLEEFKKSMEGIYSTSVGVGTLDESPMVYKNTDEILELIKPTCDVLFMVKPKINIKAMDSVDD